MTALIVAAVVGVLGWRLAAVTRAYTPSVPFWDEWELVPLVEAMAEGRLTIADLWAQHNEHRIFFPKLVMLGLARLTWWNHVVEAAASVATVLLTCVTLSSLVSRTVRGGSRIEWLWLQLVSAGLILSLSQFENVAWGWQVQFFMGVLGVVVAVWATVLYGERPMGIALGLAGAVLGSLSYAPGLFAWPVAGFTLLVAAKQKLRAAVLWFGAMALFLSAYFYGYALPAGNPSPTLVMARPTQTMRYVLAYLGAPLGMGRVDVAIAVGTGVLVLGAASVAYLVASGKRTLGELSPWIALGSFGLLSGTVTAAGRLVLGVESALSSRYITVSTPAVFAALLVTCLALGALCEGSTRVGVRWLLRSAVAVAAVALLFAYAKMYGLGLEKLVARHVDVEAGAACVLRYQLADDRCLERVYPFAARVRALAPVLERHRLSVFRQRAA